MDDILNFFARRPIAQRALLTFTVALFISCAAQISAGPPSAAPVTITDLPVR